MTTRTTAALATWTERGATATLVLCLASLVAATVGFVANSL